MRQDVLEAVGFSSDAWKVFLEGWFIRGSSRNVQITDIKTDNLGDWQDPPPFSNVANQNTGLLGLFLRTDWTMFLRTKSGMLN